MSSGEVGRIRRLYEQIIDLKEGNRVEFTYRQTRYFGLVLDTETRVGYFRSADSGHIAISDTQKDRKDILRRVKLRKIKLEELLSIKKLRTVLPS